MKDVKKLLSEALVRICEYKPLDNVTVTEIARQAGLTRQVFYRHFADKYDLAKYIHLHDYYSALDSMDMGEERGANLWGNVSRIWFDVIKKKSRFYQNVYRCPVPRRKSTTGFWEVPDFRWRNLTNCYTWRCRREYAIWLYLTKWMRIRLK